MRPTAAKTAARAAARLLVLPYYAAYRCRSLVLGELAFQTASQSLSLVPGLLGDYLRREFYRLALASCSSDCQIVFGTIFTNPAARIGRHAYIGSHCIVGNAEIGDDVLLGSAVQLLSGKFQHGIADPARPIRLQPRTFTRIRIGEDSWIGNGAIVMADVGRKCVVGAGSVVTRNIPDWSIAAGNPARVVRARRGAPGASIDDTAAEDSHRHGAESDAPADPLPPLGRGASSG